MNDYPGPPHVLELADSLHLDQTQRARVQVVFDQMLKRARELGEQIIEDEKGSGRRVCRKCERCNASRRQ